MERGHAAIILALLAAWALVAMCDKRPAEEGGPKGLYEVPMDDCGDNDGDGTTNCGGDCDDEDSTVNLRDFDRDGRTSCDGDPDDRNPNLR